MNDIYSIQSDRIYLREILENDADIIVKWRADPQVYKYFRKPHKLTIEKHKEWFDNVYVKRNDMIYWMALFKGIPIGVFGAKKTNIEEAEISYIIGMEFRNKGYANEAVKEIINWIYRNWKIKIVIAEIHKNNKTSIKFIEKLGFCQRSLHDNFIIYEKM